MLFRSQTEADYPLNASGDAAMRAWTLALIAHAEVGGGKSWASSDPFTLEVAAPYVAMRIPMAAGEQGRQVAIPVKVEVLAPFDGEAQVLLAGLPPRVTLEKNPLPITKGASEVVFLANVAPDSPAGQHKGLFCNVTIPVKGGAVVQSAGAGGVLRIDAPSRAAASQGPSSPATADMASVKRPAVTTNSAPAKSLSRLEKLRADSTPGGRTGP